MLTLLLLLSAALPLTVLLVIALVRRRDDQSPPAEVAYIVPSVNVLPGPALIEAAHEAAPIH